jgi:hypothetical protein
MYLSPRFIVEKLRRYRLYGLYLCKYLYGDKHFYWI